jgi:hypothetical protein
MGGLQKIANHYEMLMVGIQVMVVGWMIRMLRLEGWLTRPVPSAKEKQFATGRVHSIVSFVINPRIVPSTTWPIAHRIPRFATRIRLGSPCRRTRGGCGRCRARLPPPCVRTVPQLASVLYLLISLDRCSGQESLNMRSEGRGRLLERA